MTELADPHDVEPDELADEDRLPDEDEQTRGRREAVALTALRELGPASATEVANHLGGDTKSANISTRLRQLERAGSVRRTGRMINPDGQRGGPQVEWELMPANGHPTDATMELAGGPGPYEERLRRMAERLGNANGQIERIEAELAAAKVRADQEQHKASEAERRREAAEARARRASATDAAGDAALEQVKKERDQAQARAREAEHEIGKLRRDLTAATLRADARPAASVTADGMRERYFELLLEQARGECEEHVYDRLERLIGIGAE